MRCGFFVLCLLPMCVGTAHAQDESTWFDEVAIHTAQGVNHNLPEIPGKVLSGTVEWEPSRFEAIGLSRRGVPLGETFPALSGSLLSGVRHGHELVLAQHRGLQHNAEIGAAYTLRTPDLTLGSLGVNAMGGMGLSHALGTPTYEDGSDAKPWRRYHTQLLILYELEWRWRGVERLSFVTRGHHRSGVYGLIAPPHVGSNFLGIGLRYRF